MEDLVQPQPQPQEEEGGLVRRKSTLRKYGVDGRDVSGNGSENGNGDVPVHAPAAMTEFNNENGVEVMGSTRTDIVHFNGERGTGSIQTIVETEYSHIKQVSYETETVHEISNVATQSSNAFPSSQVHYQNTGISGDEKFSNLALSSARKSSEEGNTYTKESKVDVTEEVEKALEKRDTHDIICPNCQYCLTSRVILRRNEQKVPNGRVGVEDKEVDVEVFRCLSCFIIFIPRGNGFTKFFQCFGGGNEGENVPDPPQGDDYPAVETLVVNEQSLEDAYAKPQTVQGTRPSMPEVSVVGPTFIPAGVPSETEVLQTPAQPPLDPTPNLMPGEVVTVLIDPQPAQVHQPRELDILKSIIYGGLVESITSLGVVSSAAGAGAATLNTLGLGLANLFAGLLVIANNLREVKNEQPSQGNEQVDRYREVLGRREHFLRHATVAILSFIIFGCVAPITYAFSFRESDNRDYKLAAVAGASLFCIFLLAIGKAHVREQPKAYFKTVLHYVIMGFMTSGVSFLVGELIDELLTKLGWFDSTSSLFGTRPLETGAMQSGWASY